MDIPNNGLTLQTKSEKELRLDVLQIAYSLCLDNRTFRDTTDKVRDVTPEEVVVTAFTLMGFIDSKN